MNNETSSKKSMKLTPKGRGNNTGEKPKNFKNAITRIIKELKNFKVLVIISLVLAGLSSIITIMAPDKLSKLTDEISKGLVINSSNIEKLSTSITNNLDKEKLTNILPNIIKIDLSKENIKEIIEDDNLTEEEKNNFLEKVNEFTNANYNFELEMLTNLLNLPDNVLNQVFKETTYNDITISKQDQIELLKTINSLNNKDNKYIKIPTSIANIVLEDITLDNQLISKEDQALFINEFSEIDENVSIEQLYSKVDIMPKSIQKVIKPTMNLDKIKNIALTLVCLYVISAIFSYIESISMTTVANKFAKSLRTKISTKINKLPLSYFDKHQIGDILSRVTNDIDTIASSLNNSLSTLVSAGTLFIGTIIMMFSTNWIMALTAIIASSIGFIFMFKILGKSQKYFIQKQVELGKLNGHIEEVYSGINVVKVYNGINQSNEKFDKLNKNMYEANRKSQFLSGLMMPMMNFIGNFGYVAVCIVGSLLVMNNQISFGVIVAFITYVRLFTSPLSQIAQSVTSLQSATAASERVFEFVDEKEMSSQKEITKKLNKDKVKGEIEFKNVVFKYEGNEKPTIKDFSVHVKPGQKIAIVGPTGAGKTTMVNLLMKFYEINSGDILIDGTSTKELTCENIHSLFTMVLQDTWLFNGTIKENIIYNKKNITDERVEEVCKIVGLDHFIKTLSSGYNTILTDNDSVSSGQRQLLTIARGMLNNSPFLILDEATSNVDTRTEELVQKAMDKLTHGKTSFIIAHRLSTIKNADLILVMKDGNIIEQGNHNELIKKNGFYAELYNSQFEL